MEEKARPEVILLIKQIIKKYLCGDQYHIHMNIECYVVNSKYIMI